MIYHHGHEYGTAADIAHRLGPDITPAKVRDWATRATNPDDRLHGRLDRHHIPGRGRGTTYYRLDQAATVERMTRTSARGARRRLDTGLLVA
ncbi:hypothetical protein CSH63_24885 [Micromonospora tulbaghiae]|uniref:Uncharacterized protein n=1 Tax=Micromonospora tulbaghiae TaxID=479978 RepID=A0A386WT93_9ACTN|nr:hypothetical protein [Micromonospora tulbaghiae]AYF30620.1 hypothetical protein CSH63_24885 [Micromonospora tulbaghiae]